MLLAGLFGLSSSLLLEKGPGYITCGRQSINGDDVRVSDCHFSDLASLGDDALNPYSDTGNGNGGAIFIQRSTPGLTAGANTYFRVYIRHSLFERCRARLRGGAVDLVAQAEDINGSTFVNCSATVGGTGFIQATAYRSTPGLVGGHIQLNTSTLVNSRSSDSGNLVLNGSLSQPFFGSIRNASVVVYVLNSTAPAVTGIGGGLTVLTALTINIQLTRFVRLNRGVNVLDLGRSERATGSTLSCLLFLNNSLSESEGGIRGIIYANFSYTISDALFWGNDVPRNFYAVTSGSAVLTLVNCLIDAGAAVTGRVTTINCTGYHGQAPDYCHFAEPTPAPSATRTAAATKKGDKSGGGTGKGKKLSKGAIAGIVIAVIVVVAVVVIGLLAVLGCLCKKGGGAKREPQPAAPQQVQGGGGGAGKPADQPLVDEPPPEGEYTEPPPHGPT